MKTIKLDADQARVVAWDRGPVLVNAGPGSGKTRVIVERIRRLLRQADPSSILAVTFTKKAAEEMQHRLKDVPGIRDLNIRTTHSYANKIFKANPRFRAWKLDEADESDLIVKKILGHDGMRWRIDKTIVKSFIASCRSLLLSPEESHEVFGQDVAPNMYEAYHRYHERMAGEQLYTFDDMLYYGVRILKEEPRTLLREQRQYKYVIVDEAQDCNCAQMILVQLVARPENNLMLVGDVDQAIYAWRGAQPEYLLRFPEEYSATVLELGRNYRCPRVVVDRAGDLIGHNERRFSKSLTATERPARIEVLTPPDQDTEARTVGEIIQQSGVDWKQHAILLRTNAQTRAFEEVFPDMKIPFVIWGEGSFYTRKEIQDMMSYLRLVVDPGNSIAGCRAINRPFRFISQAVLQQLTQLTRHRGSFLEACQLISNEGGPAGIDQFLHLYDWDKSVTPDSDPAQFMRRVIDESHYLSWLIQAEGSDTPETSRANNVEELVASARRFKTIREFIAYVDEQIARRKRQKKTANAVQIMTIHKAKGLEFECVYVVGANEGIIPHAKGEIEEERRLAYVALTRTKRDVLISSIGGNGAGAITPFVFEAQILHAESSEEKIG